MMFAEHKRWAEIHAAQFYPAQAAHPNDRLASRRIRVGYVSADFRDHPVARFIEPLFVAHDRRQVEIVCYSDVVRPDSITARIESRADTWQETAHLSDTELFHRVCQDRIDILVDLTGHMAMKRLLVFARKPAPVQVTYVGYPNTTGVSTIDYRITDAVHDPSAECDRYHVETLVRLPGGCWCYDPMDGRLPVARPTREQPGHVAFGCLNRTIKVTHPMGELWARIIMAVPNSQLLMLVEAGVEKTTLRRFEQYGIPGERLRLV